MFVKAASATPADGCRSDSGVLQCFEVVCSGSTAIGLLLR
jgi:hypothetical protein